MSETERKERSYTCLSTNKLGLTKLESMSLYDCFTNTYMPRKNTTDYAPQTIIKKGNLWLVGLWRHRKTPLRQTQNYFKKTNKVLRDLEYQWLCARLTHLEHFISDIKIL